MKLKEEEHRSTLELLKEQYQRDVAYIKARSFEGTTSLQASHEEEISSLQNEYEREIEVLTKQNSELLQQSKEMMVYNGSKLKILEEKLRRSTKDIENERRKYVDLKRQFINCNKCPGDVSK